MSDKTIEQAEAQREARLAELQKANAARDEEFICEMMEGGMSRLMAEDALQAVYYGGDAVDLDDPLWQDSVEA